MRGWNNSLEQTIIETETERLAREMHELEDEIEKNIKMLLNNHRLGTFIKLDLIKSECGRYFEFLRKI